MALDKNKLKNNLINWMNGSKNYTTKQEALQVFIDAYKNYCLDAQDISTDFPLTLNDFGALSVLINGINNNGTPALAAQIFASAVSTFWVGGTFNLITPPPGTILPEISATVTTPPDTSSLQTSLLNIFSDINSNTTIETKAQQLADALDQATKTTVVTCVGTNPSTGNPIPITGPIF